MATVQILKLNVENIKSVLISGRRREHKIIARKNSLIRKEQQREKRIEKENSLENFRLPTFGVAGLVKSTTAGIFGGLMGFLGNILAGYIVKRLPEIIAYAENVYENNIKPAWKSATKTLETIFNGIKFVFTGINNFFNPDESQKNIDETEKNMKNLNKEIDDDIKFYTGILKAVGFDVSMFEEEEDKIVNLPDPLGADKPESQQPTPTSPQMKPQQRNQGGEVLQTRMPKEVPVGDARYKNPGRAFPRVADKSLANTEAFKKNVGKFGELVKLLKSSKFMGRKGGGGGGNNRSGGGYSGNIDASKIKADSPEKMAFIATVRELEGTAGANGYNTWFGGRSDLDLSKLTVNQVVAEQKRRLDSGEATYNGLTSAAVGAGQFLYPEDTVRRMGLNPAIEKYTPELQNKMILFQSLSSRGIDPSKPLSLRDVEILGKEWASFTPYYGQTGRSAATSLNVYKSNLKEARNLGPVSNSKKKSVLIAVQPVVTTQTETVPVAVASGASQGTLNSNNDNYFDIG